MFTFNIIYMPGTVKYLYFFVLSLLKWSDCSFRLVSNGCGPAEVNLLKQFCRQQPRLELCVLPFNRVIPHDQALAYLHALDQPDYFCFMDSDIFAKGDFLTPLVPHLNQHAALFSSSSCWCKAEEQILPTSFRKMQGRFNHTDQGVGCMPGEYLFCYLS
jgi:hypothetical protein